MEAANERSRRIPSSFGSRPLGDDRPARSWDRLAQFYCRMAGESLLHDQRERELRAGKEPVKGDYVFFVPPAGDLVNRHFGPDQGPFGKQVIGMPGALVEHRGEWVFVDGVKVARMKPRTRFGEALHPGPTGVVPRDCYYVGTDHPDGFDSRYAEIGFACRKAILGTGTPIL
jgi:type IV secretory pathway protease TraF